jgi:type I restriction enzyme S subunit
VYVSEGVPFITVKNLTAGPGIDFDDTSFITESDHREFCKRTFPEKGDLLVSKDGTLGVVRLIDTDRAFSIFVSVALIKLRDKRMGPYVRFALEAPVLQRQMVGVGTGLLHIHLRDLKQDVVPMPPLAEQHEIVRRVTDLFAYADRVETLYAAARTKLEHVTPALLTKAFRGDLVPQDPNDEPAAALLERIRSARALKPPKTKRLRTETSVKMAALTKESVTEVIRQMPEGGFTFVDLRGRMPADYEALKDVVFDLLTEAHPSLRQVFDTEQQAMRLIWARR